MTITIPAIQIDAPVNFLILYFVFKKNRVKIMTHGIVKQSSSMTLVIDVYWYAFTTENVIRIKLVTVKINESQSTL